MASPKIRLITRADDLATFHSANVAVKDAYENGILKNVSVMVPCPFIQEAAEMLASVKDLCFGLHLTLNAEWDNVKWGPVLPPEKVPSLVEKNGDFIALVNQTHERGGVFEEMMAETQAQLDKARALGFNIEYLDEHMGVGRLHKANWKGEQLYERLRPWAEKEGLVVARDFYNGLPAREKGGKPGADRLLYGLNNAKPGTYAVVGHPGYDDDELRPITLSDRVPVGAMAKQRQEQHDMFTDPRVVERCKQDDVELIRYTEATSY